MRISYPYSKVFFYLGIIIILIIFSLGIVPLLIQRELITPSFGENLVSECTGIFLTVILIMGILDLREYFQWRPVKDIVLRRIGTEVSSILSYLTYLCEVDVYEMMKDESALEFSRRTLILQLYQLNVDVKLNKIAREDLLKGEEFPTLNRRARDLSDIETRYSRFLGSSLYASLMIVEENLERLVGTISRSKQIPLYYGNEDMFLKLIETWIRNIVKEIYKMHKEMEIEIW